MRYTMSQYLTTVIAAGAMLFGAQAVIAQGAPQQAPQQAAPIEVSDEDVNKFVNAYTDVQEIHNEYATRLQKVEDAQKATELQQEAQEKMQEAVTSNDISLQEYQKIAQQIGQNPELRSRVQAELNGGEQGS